MKPEITITYKDITNSKLTIAKDRIEIKIPIEVTKTHILNTLYVVERLKSFSNKIIDNLWSEDMLTRRGQFNVLDPDKLSITMYLNTSRSNNVDPITFIEGY